MAIAFSKYIAITSGVGAAAAVAGRELIYRLFTDNPNIYPGFVLEFSNTQLSDIQTLFGPNSEEYQRALFYFGFTSKSLSTPKKISYNRWASTDLPAYAVGGTHESLAVLQAITAGQISLDVGGDPITVTGIDFSTATSFFDVATLLQTAIQGYGGSNTQYTACVVQYTASTDNFTFSSGVAGSVTVDVTAGPTSDVAGPLGWLAAQGVLLVPGTDAQTVDQVLAESAELNNNFGSFGFSRQSNTLSLDETKAAAEWALAQNVRYQFHSHVTPVDATSWSTELRSIGATGLTLIEATDDDEFPEMLPPAIIAATDYTRRASVQNFMYQQANLTPTVLTTSDSDLYDGLNINYYGNTQQAGQDINFYQRGFLMGVSTDPVDMGVFANEQWLKDDAGVKLMSAFLGLPQIPANERGRSQLLAALQPTINQALINGTISAGKDLNEVQKIFITNITGDELAWRAVQNNGYWVEIDIIEKVEAGQTIFVAQYTLIYSKNDVVRKVEGQHILI